MNVKESLISVIVPVFNIEAYLSRCIESIINQTYKNLQIILVDDGSTDTSGKICDEYAAKDGRVQVIHKENGGLVSARKAGLAIITGDYAGFVDGDDYIDERFYETLLADMQKNNVDFVHMGYQEEQRDRIVVYDNFETKKYELSTELRKNLIGGILGRSGVMQMMPSIWAKLFKRDFIRKCYGEVPNSLSHGEDLFCLSLCLLKGQSIYLHKTAMYHYVRRQGSLTDADCTSTIIKISELYHSLKNLFLQYGEYEDLRYYLERYTVQNVFSAVEKSGKNVVSISYYFFKNIDIVQRKRIVIYGAGKVGQGYYSQLSRYESCMIVGWVDKNDKRYCFDYVKVWPVTQLDQWQYDMILIAVRDKEKAEQIKRELIEQRGVANELIIWEEPGSIF